jgi:hypothetical protein
MARAGRDLAAEVRAVFSGKCARCHGPGLPRPRAGFGHVLDLRRLGAEPDKVVPGKPDESGLWQQVHSGEMPPPDSPSGPLTAQQKEVIRAWIAAGAPAESSAPAPQETDDPPSPPVAWRALRWLGKFHLLIVHFPIALLAAATAGELWSVWKGGRAPSPAVRFCVGLAAASAVPAVALGWLLALGLHGPSGLLALHRWLGTAAGACAVVVAVYSELDARRGVRGWGTRALLLAGALLVGITAHFGGLLVHGRGFFDW